MIFPINITSAIKASMLSIIDKLESIHDNQSLPVFENVDIFNDQIDRMQDDSGYSFMYPAVFVELDKLENERLGSGYNAVECDYIIHLMDERLDAGNGKLDRNIEVFGYRDLIVRNLDMFRPTQAGNLVYIGGEQDYSHNNIYHYILKFRAKLVDDTANNLIQSDGTYSVAYTFDWHSQNKGATGSLITPPAPFPDPNNGVGTWYIGTTFKIK